MRYLKILVVLVAGQLLLIACGEKKSKQISDTDSLPFYTSADFTPQWIAPSDPGYGSIHRIASFSFTDQSGRTVSEKTFRGKIYVADFFFTSCPGICKQLTNNLGIVQDAFANDTSVLLLSHSVTPDMDSVPVLRQYAKTYKVQPNKWHLVTGNRDSIYTIARKSYFADEDLGLAKNSNDFLHTENLLLIDRQGRIRGVYKGTSLKDINDMIGDIKMLEKEN